MKKIIGLAISAVIMIAVTGLGTWAYYSDEEMSNSNNITAGTMDLKLGGGDSSISILASLENKAPGDEAGDLRNPDIPYVTLTNAGTLPGWLTVSISDVENSHVVSSEPGDLFPDGELGETCQIAPWIDVGNGSGGGPDGEFDVNTDYALTSGESWVKTALQWDEVNDFGGVAGQDWTHIIESMAVGDTYRFYLPWKIPYTAGNEIQGDKFSFDITFVLDQIHD